MLSFAQFEREVTGERIRDKFAASRRKGMWMGGNPPLGYDIVDRRLAMNDAERRLVLDIFEGFVRTGTAFSDNAGRIVRQSMLALCVGSPRRLTMPKLSPQVASVGAVQKPGIPCPCPLDEADSCSGLDV